MGIIVYTTLKIIISSIIWIRMDWIFKNVVKKRHRICRPCETSDKTENIYGYKGFIYFRCICTHITRVKKKDNHQCSAYTITPLYQWDTKSEYFFFNFQTALLHPILNNELRAHGRSGTISHGKKSPL